MGLKRAVLVTAILVALTSYWFYSPLPPGYCLTSKIYFQLSMANFKSSIVLSRVGSFLGFGPHTELFRKFFAFKVGDPVEGVEKSGMKVDGVPVRIYRPSGTLNETLPGIVYFHGGGWTFGSTESWEMITLRLCKDTRSVVFSVEYRLAPEFPFPAAYEDSVKVTKYFLNNAASYNVDPRRIAVTGDSAGGDLAAVVSIRLRDEKFPIPIKLQVLIYPVTQGLDFDLPSMIKNRDGPFLTREMMAYFIALYIEGKEDNIPVYSENRHVIKSFRKKTEKTFLNTDKLPKEFVVGYVRPEYPEGDEKVWNEIKEKMVNPYFSPLAAENLENLPEAYIFTANYDPLRDEGWLYGIRLKEAKNKVTMYNCEISFHPIFAYLGHFPEAGVPFAEITKFIKANL